MDAASEAPAIVRIEQALDRIEAALAAPANTPSDSLLAPLTARHDALRRETLSAIADLSIIIEHVMIETQSSKL